MLLCFLLSVVAFFLSKHYVKADIVVDGNYQYIYDNAGNQITALEIDERTGTIYLHGKHIRSNATISYRTFGYNFTLNDSNENPRSLGTSSYAYIERKENDGGGNSPYFPDNDHVVDSYKLDGTEVINAMISLLRNQKNSDGTKKYKNIMEINAALAKGVTVYMSNAFRVITRAGGSGSEADGYTPVGKLCHSYDAIIREVRDLFGVDWSQGTIDILHSYYDNPIQIKLTPFAFDVVYITEENYKAGKTGTENILHKAAEGLETICGSESSYTIEDVNNIVINGTSYQYAGNSYYKYWGKDGFYSTSFSNGTISVEHQFQRNATMYILVKDEGDNEVRIQYVDEQGKVLKDNINGGKLSLGKKYTYSSMETPTIINGKNYEYTNRWSYSYINNNGTTKNSGNLSGMPGFTISDIKKETTVTIKVIYRELEEAVSETTNISYFTPNPTGKIRADNMGAEKFNVEEGIPTTESLYGSVQSDEYLIQIGFEKISKEILYPITVTKNYTLEWFIPVENHESKGDSKTTPEITYEKVVEVVSIERVVYVKRSYSYTKIKNIDYYKISEASLNNASLPGGTVTIFPSSYSIPTLNYQCYDGEASHIVPPSQVRTGISLPPQTISSEGNVKPNVPSELTLFQTIADERVDQIMVRNDYMEFGTSIVLNNTYTKKEAPPAATNLISQPKKVGSSVLYQGNLTIDSTRSNGSYSSSGTINYSKVIGFRSNKNNTLTYSINNMNNVVVHTPVYCEGSLSNDNAQYVQLVHPDTSAVPIVLDEYGMANDFVVRVSNTGFHTSKPGYYTRDYSINTKGTASYIAKDSQGIIRNEVRFPFDVIIDIGNDKNIRNDSYLKANTWYAVGLSSLRMYVPLYVEEGVYTVEFRTIAVNGTNRLTATQTTANTDLNRYIATSQKKVQISGRLYGLTLYDIHDYPMWQEVFRREKTMNLKRNGNGQDGTLNGSTYSKDSIYYYTVGINNLNGMTRDRNSRFTLPLVFGSHPKFLNQGIVKAGYTWRFTLDTIGGKMMQDASNLEVRPSFYYIRKDGSSREEVDLYYIENVIGRKNSLIRVGDERDGKNIKTAKVGDVYLGIPKSEQMITSFIRNVDYKVREAYTGDMYTYGYMRSNSLFKTFTGSNYAKSLSSTNAGKNIMESGVDENFITKRKQSYYFNYSLPKSFLAVAKGYDVASYAGQFGLKYNEDFWKKDGYIIINFEIIAYENNGRAYMSYMNEINSRLYDHCNMWEKEGAVKTKVDYYGTKFVFKDGDVMLVPTDRTSSHDYHSGGIY